VVGAAVYGLVDLVLLYVPTLNLGAIQDRRDLIRWLIALILSVAQAFLLKLALREHLGRQAAACAVQARRVGRHYRRAGRGPHRDPHPRGRPPKPRSSAASWESWPRPSSWCSGALPT